MKLVHTAISRQFFGSERYCAELASAQAEHGDEVFVLAGCSTPLAEEKWRRELDPRVHLLFPPLWLPAALVAWWIGVTLLRIRPDIVHLHLLKGTRLMAVWKRLLKFRLFATLHVSYRKKYYSACDGIILVTESQRETLGDYAGRVVKVWNWVNPRHLRSGAAAPADFRNSVGATDEDFLFVSVGRLTHVKGMDVLIEAFKEAFQEMPKARLVLIGDGPESERLTRLIDGDPRIVLAGYRDAGPEVYGGVDVYVSASKFEPFGLTILEAMASGCPLVLTRTIGPQEFLASEASVLWSEVNDVGGLAHSLTQAYRRGKGRTAYNVALFSLDTAVEKIAQFYG